jgi:hypothetical protein
LILNINNHGYKGTCNIIDTQGSNVNDMHNNKENPNSNKNVGESNNNNQKDDKCRFYRTWIDLKYGGKDFEFPSPPNTYFKLSEDEMLELAKLKYKLIIKSGIKNVMSNDMFYENPGDWKQDKSNPYPFFYSYEFKKWYIDKTRVVLTKDQIIDIVKNYTKDMDVDPKRVVKFIKFITKEIEVEETVENRRLSNDNLVDRINNDVNEDTISIHNSSDKNSIHSSKDNIDLDNNSNEESKSNLTSPKSVTFNDVPTYIEDKSKEDISIRKKLSTKISKIFNKK